MKKYQIIYADPPWKYRQGKSIGTHFQAAADRHYDCMSYEKVCKLPIKEITDNRCILFLWATFPMLKEALTVVNAWGFEYKSLGFLWMKVNKTDRRPVFGVGYYAKSNAEICLLGTKGQAHSLVKSNSVSSIVVCSRGKHSQKPDQVRDRIVQLVGDIPRIELFAREKTEGWDVWGNEVESDIDLYAKI